MWEQALAALIKSGRLTIISPDGRTILAIRADSQTDGPDVVVRLNRPIRSVSSALWPELTLGKAYVDGALTIENGSLWDFLELCGRNLFSRSWPHSTLTRFLQSIELWSLRDAARRTAMHNASRRYDMTYALFESFLDTDMQYSCAYFRDTAMSLEDAQQEKKRRVIAKLLLEPGHRVLDIGCGWGGLAIAIAQAEAVHTTGLTSSEEQRARAQRRAREVGVDHKVAFELGSYAEIEGHFDRIVSIGLLERMTRRTYDAFFAKLYALMTEDGVALVHSISRRNGASLTCSWTRELLFPGGYVPTLSEVLLAVENAGLLVTDLEILRLHHAETLRAWRERFLRNRQHIDQTYDDRFFRMWEFYLAANEMAFRYGDLMIFQIQLAKRVNAVPITRDYMLESGVGAQEPAIARRA